MPILTRGQNESIIIGDDIKITILGTKGKDVKIWREEIYDRLDEDD